MSEDTISRKEAIDAIEILLEQSEDDEHDKTWNNAIRGSINAVKHHVPSAQLETHEERTETHACDLIDRQAAIDAHYEYCNKHPDAGFPVWSLKILEDLPSAQPDMSGYSDKLWKRAYERGRAEAQAEIVRCKDCKHKYVDGNNVRFNVCELNHNKVQSDDWYCADAERRTDESD